MAQTARNVGALSIQSVLSLTGTALTTFGAVVDATQLRILKLRKTFTNFDLKTTATTPLLRRATRKDYWST